MGHALAVGGLRTPTVEVLVGAVHDVIGADLTPAPHGWLVEFNLGKWQMVIRVNLEGSYLLAPPRRRPIPYTATRASWSTKFA